MKSFLKFLLFLGVGLGILWVVYQNQEAAFQKECLCKGGCAYNTLFDKVVHDFGQAHIGWLGVVCLAFLGSSLSRAMRWTLLIEPLGYKVKNFNTFFSIMVGYLVNLALPRAGEIAKPAALNQYEKVPVDKLMGTIVVDRVFDVLMLLLVVGLTFLLQFDHIMGFLSGESRPAATCVNPQTAVEQGGGIPWKMLFYIALGIGAAGLLLVVALWKRIAQSPLMQKFRTLAANFGEGIKAVFKLRSPGMFFFHTFFIWLMYFMMTYVCFRAYAPTASLGWDAALLAFVFGGFGVLIPSPGGMGTFQLAVTAALALYNVPNADAFAFANILFFTINVFCNLIFGILAYILLPIYNRHYQPVLPDTHSVELSAEQRG